MRAWAHWTATGHRSPDGRGRCAQDGGTAHPGSPHSGPQSLRTPQAGALTDIRDRMACRNDLTGVPCRAVGRGHGTGQPGYGHSLSI